MNPSPGPFRLTDNPRTVRFPYNLPWRDSPGVRFMAFPNAQRETESEDLPAARPNAYAAQMGRQYRRIYRALSRRHAESRQQWPDWCFTPMPVVRSELAAMVGRRPDAADIIWQDAPFTAGLAAWRVTRGVYQFHPALLDAVWDSTIDGQLPIDMFRFLPEWCVYIPVNPPRNGIHGTFAFLDDDPEDSYWERHRLILLVDQGDALVDVEIQLKPGADILGSLPMFSGYELTPLGPQPIFMPADELQYLSPLVDDVVRPLISLVLFLCTRNDDLVAGDNGDESRPSRPTANLTGRGPVFPTPTEPRRWDVGYRIGAALQRAHRSQESVGPGRPGRAPMRPHIRRAHWHRYWIGPRNEPDNRSMLARWIPPIAVAMGDDDLPTTIRPVNE